MSSLGSVDEIFKRHAVAEIKTMEIDIRSMAAAKSTELRLLVGESYRDLLTTADTIVQMREETNALRQQLKQLASDCDGQMVHRKLKNLQSFSRQQKRAADQAIVAYLQNLRGLVLTYLKRGDLVMASRLYAFGRLLAGPLSKAMPHISTRMHNIRRIIIQTINTSANIREFAGSFAIMESASPVSCLRHFLSIKLEDFSTCTSLRDLTSALLQTIDSTRQFSELGTEFSQISRKTLLSTIIALPELNGQALSDCVTEDIRQYKPYLPSEELDTKAISTSVSAWVNSISNQLEDLADKILSNQTGMSQVLAEAKSAHEILSEASQDSIYEYIAPAIGRCIDGLLQSSISHLRSFKDNMSKIIDFRQVVDGPWKARIPWTSGSVYNFKTITRKIIRGDPANFARFDVDYLACIQTIQDNIQVLETSRIYHAPLSQYRSAVRLSIEQLRSGLFEDEKLLQDPEQVIQVLRLSIYLTKTAPMALESTMPNSLYLDRLLPHIHFQPSTRFAATTFEDDCPVTLSPEATGYLLLLSTKLADLGLDIVGPQERAIARLEIQRDLHQVLTQHDQGRKDKAPTEQITSVTDSGTTDGEEPKGDSILPQNRPQSLKVPSDDQVESTVMLDDKKDIDVAQETVALQHDTLVVDPTGTTPSILQFYFDLKFMEQLLSLSALTNLDRLVPEVNIQTQVQKNIQKAVLRSKLLYGNLIG